LLAFRAVAVPCAASWQPARAAELASAARAAVNTAMSAVQDQSVNASCASANAATTLDPTLAVNASAPAINAARFAARSAGDLDAFDRALKEDAATIDLGGSGVDLIGQPLWTSGRLNSLANRWLELKDALLQLNQEWEVWTDWYEARLGGDAVDPPNEALEVARATIPDEIWKQGPAVVNAEIKRLTEKYSNNAGQREDQISNNDRAVDAIEPQSKDFVTILGARSALRVIPLLVTDRQRIGDRNKSKFVLAIFRAFAVAWASARYPSSITQQSCLAAARDVKVYAAGS